MEHLLAIHVRNNPSNFDIKSRVYFRTRIHDADRLLPKQLSGDQRGRGRGRGMGREEGERSAPGVSLSINSQRKRTLIPIRKHGRLRVNKKK